ncbi:hypothetical protein JSQ81_08780 [Sporosarcina sp. Marseille-Q4063]|uniref:hypothetical protein n=1 Tax=Sporosarcina sp. Marseille-Q4063 TaxID=2810514 RepID=UPI001BAEE31A|nr:hypothetical protein [Sporosarcina sp. Marseille-Q4063]QUW23579.1 hypothetical protein JSQ81_08780 [Sporosarcina sp. Marseille-Q4063]
MKCGAKQYHIEFEIRGERKITSVAARTPAEARKKFRVEYGEKSQIISVRVVV